MPYKVNLPPFDASGRVYTSSPYPAKAETVETLETKPAPPLSPGAKDPYQTAAEEALRAICTPDYPAGMILWLEQTAPAIYRRVVVDLPDRISLAWECHVPIADFWAILNEWVKAHQSACAEYRQHVARNAHPQR